MIIILAIYKAFFKGMCYEILILRLLQILMHIYGTTHDKFTSSNENFFEC